jgi:methionyl aminopeptidase
MREQKLMIGRNDPCWCGSGKKYKKCHMKHDMATERTTAPPQKNIIKTPGQIAGMRKAGAFNGELMDYIRPFIKAGISTQRIDELVYDYTVKHGHTPACLGYHGFPKSLCTSINNVVCHGIPSEKEILEDGDIINVDLTTIVDGYHGDSSETFLIGAVSDEAKRLVWVTARALQLGIEAIQPGRTLKAIAEAIEPFVRSHGCSVVRQYTGHGVGLNFHEFFTVYHHIEDDAERVVMQPGMTFTVEPMINAGGYTITTDRKDGWTVRTKDGALSAQFEHTILVTDTGADILTLTPTQKKAGKNVMIEGIEL